jgi:hypothetical protein
MFSRAIVLYRQRYYSTPKEALKLWVKHNGSPSTQVPVNGCINLDDFADKVKQKLNTSSQIAVFTSLDKEAVDPGLAIKDLFKMDGLKNNTSKTPLFVKVIPTTQDTIASKTIHIRDIDEECKPLDSYTEVVVECDAHIKEIYENKGSALYKITEPKKRITMFKQLKDGEKYGVFSRYEQSFDDEVRWQQKEDMAMEEEVALALKSYLHLHLGSTVIDMPTDVFGINGNIVQEWDAAFKVDDVLYLCEAKHVMSSDKVPKIPQRIQTFKEQFQPHAQEEFSIGINKVVGVACATYFPPLVRKEAQDLGLICVYPSGWRYHVDKKLPTEFKIERYLNKLYCCKLLIVYLLSE